MRCIALVVGILVAALIWGCAEPDDAEVAAVAASIYRGTPPEKAMFEAGLDTAALVRFTKRLLGDPDRLYLFLDLLQGELEE